MVYLKDSLGILKIFIIENKNNLINKEIEYIDIQKILKINI